MAKVVCPDINDGFFGMSADDDDFYSDRAALEFKKRRVLVSYRILFYIINIYSSRRSPDVWEPPRCDT